MKQVSDPLDDAIIRRIIVTALTTMAAESARRAGLRLQDWLDEAKAAFGVHLGKKGKRR